MIYPKISSCFSKIVCAFVLLFCYVGSLKATISDRQFIIDNNSDPKPVQKKGDVKYVTKKPEYYDDGHDDIYPGDSPSPEHLLTEKENTKDQTNNDNDTIVIQFGMKDGKMWAKNNQNFKTNLYKNSFYIFTPQKDTNPHGLDFFHGFLPHDAKDKYLISLLKLPTTRCIDRSNMLIPKEWLRSGMTVFLSKSNDDQITIKKGVNPSDLVFSGNQKGRKFVLRVGSSPLNLSSLASSNDQKICYHIQANDNDSIWIKSNYSLKSEKNEDTLVYSPYTKQSFGKREITIDGVGILQKDGSFKLDSKISSSSLSDEDIKKGVTFVLQNGKVTWHPEIIPFEELEDPADDYYAADQPYQSSNYAPTTETQSETESSYFSSISDNKATIACTAIGVAVTAIVAHVLSGRRYLSKTETWSNWEPNNLDSVGLRALPEDVLLKQLYHEIAYRYGNCSDQIKAFLEEIEQEIHELNLCYWSYSILRGIYLLPKIQRFEKIESRINLLTMLADTVRQDLANKSIKNLLN